MHTGNNFLAIDNNLIRASYKLTVNEMRLLLVALAQMPKNEPVNPNQAYYITKNDFVKLGVEPKNVAREIREACNDLLGRVVVINTPVGELGVHWVLNILNFKTEIFESLKKKYPDAQNDQNFLQQLKMHNLLDSLPVVTKSDDNIIARIVFHPNMIPFISDLKEQFTKFNINDFFTFGSIYSFRIYLMMMQFKETGFCKISLSDLRKSLELQDKYDATKDFKKRVIDTAAKEINEKTPYKLTYDLLKTGRKFTHLELHFESKRKSQKEEIVEDFKSLTDKQITFFAKKLAYDSLFSGQYAEVGEEYPDLEKRLIGKLSDTNFVQKITSDLKRLGFKS